MITPINSANIVLFLQNEDILAISPVISYTTICSGTNNDS